jgi:hypothetical protein
MKRDGFTVSDLRAVAAVAGLPRGRTQTILAEVTEVVSRWPQLAREAGVAEPMAEQSAATHRLGLPAG